MLRATLEGMAFIQKPANHEAVVKSLVRHLRLSTPKEAESGYEVLQWLYSIEVRHNVKGIQNMRPCASLSRNIEKPQ